MTVRLIIYITFLKNLSERNKKYSLCQTTYKGFLVQNKKIKKFKILFEISTTYRYLCYFNSINSKHSGTIIHEFYSAVEFRS